MSQYGIFGMTFQVEFLPVYNPSKDEQEDAKLFASNVRRRMATRLNIPMVDRSVTEMTLSTLTLNAEEDAKIEFAPPYVIDFVGNLTQT